MTPEQPHWVRSLATAAYPIALAGVLASAVLNALSWLPFDVSPIVPVTFLLFAGVFPVWLAAISVLVQEQQLRRASQGKTRWWQSGPRFRWRDVLINVPRWTLLVFLVIAAYAYINFFASLAQLPGQPEIAAGNYYFVNHGSYIPTTLAGYMQGLRVEVRMLTGHPMVFFGLAALVMYGRRRPAAGSLSRGATPL